jgi:hypothetical protein
MSGHTALALLHSCTEWGMPQHPEKGARMGWAKLLIAWLMHPCVGANMCMHDAAQDEHWHQDPASPSWGGRISSMTCMSSGLAFRSSYLAVSVCRWLPCPGSICSAMSLHRQEWVLQAAPAWLTVVDMRCYCCLRPWWYPYQLSAA